MKINLYCGIGFLPNSGKVLIGRTYAYTFPVSRTGSSNSLILNGRLEWKPSSIPVMQAESLFRFLSSVHPLGNEFKSALEKELILLSPPKNYVLLDPPRISEHAYFLVDGFAISYSFVKGRKVTEAFWKSGQIMVAFESFFEQIPSLEVIQLLEPSEVLCISYASVQRLFALYPEAQILYRIIMNRHYTHCRNRVRDLQQLSASQRLDKLIAAFPNIELIAPQDSIASYLGITAQSLSRLKRQKTD